MNPKHKKRIIHAFHTADYYRNIIIFSISFPFASYRISSKFRFFLSSIMFHLKHAQVPSLTVIETDNLVLNVTELLTDGKSEKK